MRKENVAMSIIAIVATLAVIAISRTTLYFTGSLGWAITAGVIVTEIIGMLVTINVHNGAVNRIR